MEHPCKKAQTYGKQTNTIDRRRLSREALIVKMVDSILSFLRVELWKGSLHRPQRTNFFQMQSLFRSPDLLASTPSHVNGQHCL